MNHDPVGTANLAASVSEMARGEDLALEHLPTARHVLEFVILLALAGILFRNFVAEAYLVPSGSMAPTLLGFHKRVLCPHCGHAFAVGVEEHHPFSREVVCANCGHEPIEVSLLPVNAGDRLLVHKWVYDFRPPNRWETVVFRNPNDAMQAYVKRVVGLPGEKVQILQGDIYVNGRIARKSHEQFLELCLTVYHQCQLPSGARVNDRWVPATAGSQWATVDDHLAIDGVGRREIDEVVYRHHDPDGFETSVRDDYGYNASRSVWHHDVVGDLLLRFLVTYKAGNGFLRISVRTPTARTFSVDADPNDGTVRLFANESLVREGKVARWRRQNQPISVGFFDQRLAVRFGDEAPFPDFDLDDEIASREESSSPTSQPFAIGVSDLNVEVHDLRIDRDIYYGSQVLESYNPAGVRKPFELGVDEYFVLGDNSPISNDSRIWENPAVQRSLFIGKPIVVHLPSQTWQGRVFGRQIPISLPDLGNVRRVR